MSSRFHAILILTLALAHSAHGQNTSPGNSSPKSPLGQLEILGEPGPSQLFAKVKAQRCRHPQGKNLRNGTAILQRLCDAPLYLDLNQTVALPTGKYILGFENSLYPGFIEITEGQLTHLELEKIQIPPEFKGDKLVRIFRDFSSLVEQRKLYFQHYYSGRHFFRLTDQYNFGDYYLTDGQRPDAVQWRTFDLCSSISSFSEPREQAKLVCSAWNTAKSMMDMADLFKFENQGGDFDGMFQEALIAEPGDIQAVRHKRHLVGAPTPSDSFVAVFPGVYRISVEGKNGKSLRVVTGGLQESYEPQDLDRDLKTEDSTCGATGLWRTEQRSYCTQDKVEGCDRTLVKKCETLRLDLRFRKY